MDIQRVIDWYNNPPRANDIAAWAEIHRAMGTPDGSCFVMGQWALQRMGQMILKHANRNNVAPTATFAQDATQGQPVQQANQDAGSDPVKDLEAMRDDLKTCVQMLGESAWKHERDLAKHLGEKWGLQ